MARPASRGPGNCHISANFSPDFSLGYVDTFFPWKESVVFVRGARPARVTVKINPEQETRDRDKEHHTLGLSMDVFINV
jgi:hypothetical protein